MKQGIPSAPVRNLDEVVHDENMHERGALQYVDHPQYGRIIVQQTPLRFVGEELMTIAPSRELGADTEAVLREMTTLSEEEITTVLQA